MSETPEQRQAREQREADERTEQLRKDLEKAENDAALRKINALQDWAGIPRTE